jgi:hypothetical protein
VYVRDPAVRPQVVVLRGGVQIDVTNSYLLERTPVPLFLEDNSCTGEGTTVQYPLQRFTIELSDVIVVGDRLAISGASTENNEGAVVTKASTECPAPIAPTLACPDDTPETCDEIESGGGCTSSRTPGLATLFALGLAGVCLLRQRRR